MLPQALRGAGLRPAAAFMRPFPKPLGTLSETPPTLYVLQSLTISESVSNIQARVWGYPNRTLDRDSQKSSKL